MGKYFAVITTIGVAKLANAAAFGTDLELSTIAVGDGGGDNAPEPTPDPSVKRLAGERRRAPINMLGIDPDNPSQFCAQQLIPENVGGWWVREVGLFDSAGDLIVYGNYPSSYKPMLQEGSGKPLVVEVYFAVSSTENIVLKIDPAAVVATRKYVDDKVIEVKAYTDKAMDEHLTAAHPHRQYAKEEEVGKALKALEEKVKINARPVLHRDWASCRAAIPVGEAPADGQIIENGRALYPEAWAAIQAGLVPVCSDAEWLANPSKAGCFTTGDGKTNFRIPDYNGKRADSLGSVVFRGDGKNAAAAGDVQGDAGRKIKGVIGTVWGTTRTDSPFYEEEVHGIGIQLSGTANKYGLLGFDSSRVVPTAPEYRMVNVAGVWTIHLFGAVLNSGSVDAAAMATAIAGLSARVSTLESAVNARKSTCLVNAVGTGAPHETVVTQLPAGVAVNSRYVLPNPFGSNTPVYVRAEVLYNGIWSDSGFIYGTTAGHGTHANYVQGVGVVVQTGDAAVLTIPRHAGGGHGYAGDAAITTPLPCRVFVRKLEA